ncbi:MAG: hypothetical protein INQ03_05515 [Candidatus Heimdallarchaeota archaeon]|nr:hypothetical protein [Candidatus Heimdallarchaeota archaeon]
MSVDSIKAVLDSGECPHCQAPIISDEDMTTYHCEQSREHFELKVTFHGGEKITAILNGKEVDETQLREIEW